MLVRQRKSSRISPTAPVPYCLSFNLRPVIEPDDYTLVVVHRDALHQNAEGNGIELLSMLRQILQFPDETVRTLATILLVADLHLERRVSVKQFLIPCVQRSHYLDEQRMCRLYEKFILNYYRREHPEIIASAARIDWQLDDGMGDMLPLMQTDITLASRDERHVLIIDAKYYAHATQVQFRTHTLHSGNLYQIFTYVKNKEFALKDHPHEVAGMLLYAKTDEEIAPDHVYQMSGNRIAVKTLDLNQEFERIRKQLDEICHEFFG